MRPAPRLLLLLTGLTAVGLVLALGSWPLTWWLWPLGALALLVTADGWMVWRRPAPAVTRVVARSLALGVWAEVALNIRHEGGAAVMAEVFDHYPPAFVGRDMSQRVRLPAGRTVTVTYSVKPTRRGRWQFAGCQLRVLSPLGLLTMSRMATAAADVNVYPDFAAVTKYALLGTDSQFSQTGVRHRRRRGEGLEFQQLREYREGDSFRQIDWKATARSARLIAKEYQDERDQQIVFLLDTGRRMLAREGDYSHFDHVLNAMLLLSYVALRQGDAVGFMSLGDSSRWMIPRKGVNTVNVLLRRTFDLEPSPAAIDYEAAAMALAVRQKRRALIVLLTNIRDEDTDDLLSATRLLRHRHLLLIASLRESELDARLRGEVTDFDSALSYAATSHYLLSRRLAHEKLTSAGVLVQDSTCQGLPAAITNRYLDIKRAGRL